MESDLANMPTIDYAKLLEMFMGNVDKVNFLIDTLQTRVPQWQAELDQAIKNDNHEEIRKVCHRIRGAAGTITAKQAAHFATALGDAIKTENFSAINQLAAKLAASLKEITNFQPPNS